MSNMNTLSVKKAQYLRPGCPSDIEATAFANSHISDLSHRVKHLRTS